MTSKIFSRQIEEAAEKNPDLDILTFEYGENYPEEILTYRDIVSKGCKIAEILKENGIKKGDKFATLMDNHPEFVYSFWAASAIGAVMVPLDTRTDTDTLKYQIEHSDSKGVFLTNIYLNTIEEIEKGLSDFRVLGVSYKPVWDTGVSEKYANLDEILKGPEVSFPEDRKDDPDTPLEIIYTSGTTGRPKGVIMKEQRLQMYADLAKMVWQYSGNDKLYTGLSLNHGNAQAVTLVPSLVMMIPAVFSHRFTKSRIWDICRKYGCTTFSLLGGMMMGIYSEPEREDDADNPVRLVISAGTPPSIWRDFEKRFNVVIHEWYGAVEGGFAHNPPGVGPVGSFGKPPEGLIEMKVVREDDTECEPYEVGELICRNVQGKTEVEYYKNEEASREKTRGGWLRTGDMCHRDENGWFYFDYRKGEALRRKGEFIQPAYIEQVIARHPDVNEVCVYGIQSKDGAPGESDIVAAIVPLSDKYDIEFIYKSCVEELNKNLIPSYIQVIDEIPKTKSEKNLDRLLKEKFSPEAENVYSFEQIVKKK